MRLHYSLRTLIESWGLLGFGLILMRISIPISAMYEAILELLYTLDVHLYFTLAKYRAVLKTQHITLRL